MVFALVRFWAQFNILMLPCSPNRARGPKQKIKQMAQEVKAGDTVQVHYHGRLSDGTTFDSSEGRTPLEFEVGSGMVIKGFDDGVMGMTVGQKKTIEIPVEDAYGPRDPQAIIEFPIDRFPPEVQPELGMQLAMNNGQGQQIPVVIVDVKDDIVVLDANHQLAGQDLIFDLELVDIKSPSRIIMP
jgi:FKBP-type peptidyl-prolyl cis-trans isomerase 2